MNKYSITTTKMLYSLEDALRSLPGCVRGGDLVFITDGSNSYYIRDGKELTKEDVKNLSQGNLVSASDGSKLVPVDLDIESVVLTRLALIEAMEMSYIDYEKYEGEDDDKAAKKTKDDLSSVFRRLSNFLSSYDGEKIEVISSYLTSDQVDLIINVLDFVKETGFVNFLKYNPGDSIELEKAENYSRKEIEDLIRMFKGLS